jgi:hypothetical protein
MTEQVPSIGRIVHWVTYGSPRGEYPSGEHRAAVITEVYQDGASGMLQAVGLCVLNPTGQFFNRNVPYEASGTIAGTWHWPEHVPPRQVSTPTPEPEPAQHHPV